MKDTTKTPNNARGSGANNPSFYTSNQPATDEYGNPLDEPANANSFEYDEELAPGFFIQVRSDFLRSAGYSAYAKVTYCILLTWAGAGYNAWPGQERLAAEVGVSVRTLRDVIDEMKEKGLLTVKRRGLGKTNVYRVHKLPMGQQTPPAEPRNSDRQILPIKNNTYPDRQNLPIRTGTTNRSGSAARAGELDSVVLDSEELDSEHTQTIDVGKRGAVAPVCVDIEDTYPIIQPKAEVEQGSNGVASGIPDTQYPHSQDTTTRRSKGSSTSDRVRTPKPRQTPLKTPVDGPQSQIEARLRSAKISAAKARDLATQIVATGRDLDYVERWIALGNSEKIVNPAAYLVKVLGENAEPPPNPGEREVKSWYSTHSHLFNQQPDETKPHTSP